MRLLPSRDCRFGGAILSLCCGQISGFVVRPFCRRKPVLRFRRRSAWAVLCQHLWWVVRTRRTGFRVDPAFLAEQMTLVAIIFCTSRGGFCRIPAILCLMLIPLVLLKCLFPLDLWFFCVLEHFLPCVLRMVKG